MILYNQDTKFHKCDFCHRHQTVVRQMITGLGGSAICDRCVEECTKILIARGFKLSA